MYARGEESYSTLHPSAHLSCSADEEADVDRPRKWLHQEEHAQLKSDLAKVEVNLSKAIQAQRVVDELPEIYAAVKFVISGLGVVFPDDPKTALGMIGSRSFASNVKNLSDNLARYNEAKVERARHDIDTLHKGKLVIEGRLEANRRKEALCVVSSHARRWDAVEGNRVQVQWNHVG
jgi:hypothetical protein